MKSIQIRIWSIFEYATALFVILDCYSVLSISEYGGIIVKAFGVLCALPLAIRASLSRIRNGVYLPLMLFWCAAVILGVIFLLINDTDKRWEYAFVYLVWLSELIWIFSQEIAEQRMNSLLIKLSNIMVLIAGVSLVFYLFGTLLPIIPEFSTVDANWGLITSYKNFWGVYYEGQGTWVKDILLTRNIGIFAEGPMFSYCLVIALYIQIFLNRETKISQVAVLALAIVTTFSYCGIMCMIVTFMFKYIRDNMQSKAKMSKMVLFLPIICLLVLVSFDWLVNDKLNSISGSTRLDDLEAGFMAWKDSPIWGQGYNEGEAINAYKGFWRDEHSGYSNAIMKILAECGIVFSLLYIIPFISALLNIRKNYSFFVGAIVMLLLLFTTVVPYKLITVLLVVSGWRCMFYAEKRFIKKCLVETPKDVLVKPL